MFGNIGGSVDFMIILILICFNWIENLLVAKKVRNHMYESLNLAPMLAPEKPKKSCGAKFFCCRKNKGNQVSAMQSTKGVNANDAVDGLAEDALNLETLAKTVIQMNYIIKHLAPQGSLELAPSIAVMEKMLEEKRESQKEEKEKQEKKAKSSKELINSSKSTPGHSPMNSMNKLTKTTIEVPEEEVNLEDAYRNLISSKTNTLHNFDEKIKNHYQSVVNDFCREFDIDNSSSLFKDSE